VSAGNAMETSVVRDNHKQWRAGFAKLQHSNVTRDGILEQAVFLGRTRHGGKSARNVSIGYRSCLVTMCIGLPPHADPKGLEVRRVRVTQQWKGPNATSLSGLTSLYKQSNVHGCGC
jgi:hypothetical protein